MCALARIERTASAAISGTLFQTFVIHMHSILLPHCKERHTQRYLVRFFSFFCIFGQITILSMGKYIQSLPSLAFLPFLVFIFFFGSFAGNLWWCICIELNMRRKLLHTKNFSRKKRNTKQFFLPYEFYWRNFQALCQCVRRVEWGRGELSKCREKQKWLGLSFQFAVSV